MKKTIGSITNKITGEVLKPYKKELREKLYKVVSNHLCCKPIDVSFFDLCDYFTEIKRYTNCNYIRKGNKYSLIGVNYDYKTTSYSNIQLAMFYLISNNLD
jgi:hypothetical protein